MPSARDPLAGVRMVVIDGSNLAHALGRRSGAGAVPRSAVVGRIRAAIPAEVAIELAFDGPPEPGSTVRAASRLTVRYGGRRPADAVVLERVEVESESAGRGKPGAGPSLLVVTDDAELARAARLRGAATARTAWLIARLERGRLAAPAAGNPRPPASSAEPGRAGRRSARPRAGHRMRP